MIRVKYYEEGHDSEAKDLLCMVLEWQNLITDVINKNPSAVEIRIGETNFITSNQQDLIDFATASQSPCMKRAFQDELVELIVIDNL